MNVHLGYGTHAAVIQQKGGEELLEKVLLINFGPDFSMGIMGFATPKLAVVALLSRILNPGKIHRFLLWFMASFVLVASIICIIVILTNCSPHEALWKTRLMAEGATCRDPWIMVNYCIFTGGRSIGIALYSSCTTEADGIHFSHIRLRRPIPCFLSDFRINEAPNAVEKEGRSMCGFRARRRVSAGI